MSNFSLEPILATTLNRCSFAASSATTYSSAPASFSLLASLISPVSGVLLYDVSIASNRAQSSLISLSTAGSGKVLSERLLGGIFATCPHRIQSQLLSVFPLQKTKVVRSDTT
jgi:hypothetical protein